MASSSEPLRFALLLASLTSSPWLWACSPSVRSQADAGPGAEDLARPPDLSPVGARMTGKAWGPGHLFPVSAALVAGFGGAPDPIPEGAYCQRCVELPPGAPSTLSAPDGSFTLDLHLATTYQLVVQKGEFRSVRAFTTPAAPGVYPLDEALTTLPGRSDPAKGDTIPSIALAYGDYDSIQDVLGKVGIGSVGADHGFVWGSEGGVFDVFDDSGPTNNEKHGEPLMRLLLDPARLAGYQVVFFTCSYNAGFSFMTDSRIQTNLRDWVRAGGKLYVSDYAYLVIERTWPDFIEWTNPLRQGGCDEKKIPDGCNHGPPFEAPSRSPDPGLSAWLFAADPTTGGMPPVAEFTTRENWDTLAGVAEAYVGDSVDNGGAVQAGPTVWVEGTWNYEMQDVPAGWDYATYHPFTVGFPYGCGRVLYTTYHTVGGTDTAQARHPGLITQELVLWYLIMELQACQDLRIQ